MKAVDTNVLVRFLTEDDEEQAALVYVRFRQAENAKEALFVPLLVLLETIWVLKTAYGFPRKEILDSIVELTLLPILEIEALAAVHGFLETAQGSQADLADLLIAHSAKAFGCETVLTLDRKAAKSELFELLS